MKKYHKLAFLAAAWFTMWVSFLQSFIDKAVPNAALPGSLYVLDFVFFWLVPVAMTVFSLSNLIITLIRLYAWLSLPQNLAETIARE